MDQDQHISKGIQENPWRGFVSSETTEEEISALPRTVRFAFIQIQKFWIEIQSFPLFLKVLKNATLPEVETLLTWMGRAPDWSLHLPDGRAIPEMSRAASRRVFLDFVRDVKAVRAIRQEIHGMVAEENRDTLAEAVTLIRRQGLESLRMDDLISRFETLTETHKNLSKVAGFFEEFSAKAGVPHAKNPTEGLLLFQMVDSIGRIPEAVIPWRTKTVLDPAKRIRIEAWQNRMRPAIESRKRLEEMFHFEKMKDPLPLRELAERLNQRGWFRAWQADFKEAVEVYRNLLLDSDPAALKGVSPHEMAQNLVEWADHIEQAEAFATQLEARQFFGEKYCGIDTDFASAMEANQWGSQIRQEIDETESQYSRELLRFLFETPETQLHEAFVFGTSPSAESIRKGLQSDFFAEAREFVEYFAEFGSQLTETERLLTLLKDLGWNKDLSFDHAESVFARVDEVLFLVDRVNQATSVKECLKNTYHAENTNLDLIERALDFSKFIEKAQIPDALKLYFLTPHGPQRLTENQNLVTRALRALKQVQEHVMRLHDVSRGEVESWLNEPTPVLLEGMQEALNRPRDLGVLVEELQRGPGIPLTQRSEKIPSASPQPKLH